MASIDQIRTCPSIEPNSAKLRYSIVFGHSYLQRLWPASIHPAIHGSCRLRSLSALLNVEAHWSARVSQSGFKSFEEPPEDRRRGTACKHTTMLKEIRLDEFHSCKQGRGGGRFAWLGGLLSLEKYNAVDNRDFRAFASLFGSTRSGLGPCGVQRRVMLGGVYSRPHGTEVLCE